MAVNHLVLSADQLLKDIGVDYAFCGGFAIELFLGREVRTHGDIDVSVWWDDRDKIICYMQQLGWHIYEMCGGGIVHLITDVTRQTSAKRNIFCFKPGCRLVKLSPTGELDMCNLDFDHSGQQDLDYIEFLFNSKGPDGFQYSRNPAITRTLSDGILHRDGIPYLAPELALLYKSTDITRQENQLDYASALFAMSPRQIEWLKKAVSVMNPQGHPWL